MFEPLQIIEKNASARMATISLTSKLLQTGIIEINDEFNPDTVSNWRNALMYLSSELTPQETQANPIQIYINSPGGDVYSLLGLYDVIENLKNKGYVISTINVGLAASAAAIILMAGSKGYRKSLSHCRTMLHTVSSETYGKVGEIKAATKEVADLQNVLNTLISENAKPELLEHIQYVDYWMSAEEAKEQNIIDSIL